MGMADAYAEDMAPEGFQVAEASYGPTIAWGEETAKGQCGIDFMIDATYHGKKEVEVGGKKRLLHLFKDVRHVEDWMQPEFGTGDLVYEIDESLPEDEQFVPGWSVALLDSRLSGAVKEAEKQVKAGKRKAALPMDVRIHYTGKNVASKNGTAHGFKVIWK